MTTATPELQEQEAIQQITANLHHFPTFCSSLVKCKLSTGGIGPLNLNLGQRIFWAIVKALTDLNCPIRVDILKSRKIGFSTEIGAYLAYCAVLRQHMDGLVIAHREDSTTKLFEDKIKFIFDNFPEGMQAKIGASNKREVFLEEQQSHILCQTAGHTDIGRSFNIQIAHFSEIAFWPDFERVAVGLFNAVPKKPRTAIFTETTANRYNAYKDYWDMVVKDFGLDDPFIRYADQSIRTWLEKIIIQCQKHIRPQVPLFIPYFIHEEYIERVPDDFELTDIEKERLKEFHLTLPQISWYREATREEERKHPGRGDQVMAQEYPHTPEEAFLASGQVIFNAHSLTQLAKHTKPPIMKLQWDGVKFVKHPDGELWVWEKPKQDWRYCMGVDVGEGRQQDDTVAQVGRIEGYRYIQVAEWVNNTLDPLMIVPPIRDIAITYNKAITAVETNTVGMMTNDQLSKKYFNIYQWEYFDHMVGKNQLSRKSGWYTNEHTKELLITLVNFLMLNDQLVVNSKRLMHQLSIFTNEDGQADDLTMAYLIAIMAIHKKLAPFWQDPKAREPEPDPMGRDKLDPAYHQISHLNLKKDAAWDKL